MSSEKERLWLFRAAGIAEIGDKVVWEQGYGGGVHLISLGICWRILMPSVAGAGSCIYFRVVTPGHILLGRGI